MTDVNDPNPYTSPSASTTLPPSPSSALAWSPTEAIEFGWNTMKREPMSILAFFVAQLVANGLTMIGAAINGVLTAQQDPKLLKIGLAIYAVCAVIGLPLSFWMQMGMTRYALKLARRQPVTISELFAGGPYWSFLGAALLTALGVGFGMLLCFVPGVIFMLGSLFNAQMVVDRRLGPIEAIGASWRLTTGHKGQLFIFGLLAIGVILLGELACCVGVLVALPIVMTAVAYIYLKLSGEQPPPAVS